MRERCGDAGGRMGDTSCLDKLLVNIQGRQIRRERGEGDVRPFQDREHRRPALIEKSHTWRLISTSNPSTPA
jgi:hypothetical protein